MHHVGCHGVTYQPCELIRFEPAEVERYERDQGGPIGELLAAVQPAPHPELKPMFKVIEFNQNELHLAGPDSAS